MHAFLQLIVLLALCQGTLTQNTQTLVVQSSNGCTYSTQNSLGGNGCLFSSILSSYVKGVSCSSAEGLIFNTYSDNACTAQISQYTLPPPFTNAQGYAL